MSFENTPSKGTPVYLSGYNLNFYVNGDTQILKDITVCFQPNELVAVMGPSGGGKTTLMDVLSGRATSGRVEGHVLFGDKRMNTTELKSVANYVPQDDILYPGLTAREHLFYTAELRLPESMGKAEKEDRVNQILDALSIQDCSDSIVGGVELRGISGGQKKRTSVGMELVTDPSGLFLDEPTTGLDSKTAEDLVKMLANLAHSGRTIMCSIHQPSPQVFRMFDRLVFLSAGNVVFDGPVTNAVPYFAAIGHSCPPDENPADFIMEVVSEGGPEGAETFAATWLKKKSSYQADYTQERERLLPDVVARLGDEGSVAVDSSSTQYPTSFTSQFLTLFERSFLNYARDIWGYPLRFVMGVMTGMMLGTIWINLEQNQEESVLKLSMYAMLNAAIGYDHILGSATVFPGERSMVLREYKNGYYRLFAYFSSRSIMMMMSQIPYLICMTVQVWGFCHLRAGFGHWLFMLSVAHMCAMNASMLGMLLGTFVADATIANIYIPMLGMPTVMTNGYFILPDNMPFYIEAWTDINFGTYSFKNFVINEFTDLAISPCVSQSAEVCPYGCDPVSCDINDARTTPVDGDTILGQMDYDDDSKWLNYLFLACSTWFWFFMAYAGLRYRVDRS